jgi:hypothetical protein
VVHFGLRQLGRHHVGHEAFDEEVLLKHLPLHEACRHRLAKELRHQILERPEPRVSHHEPADPLVSFKGDREPDRTAPVLHHNQKPINVEMVDEFPNDARLLAGGIAISLGAIRKPEAGVIDRDAPKSIL